MSLFDLRGCRVLVTGGSGGIGLALVRAFTEAGAVVASLDRVPPVNDLRGSTHTTCDVAVPEEVEARIGELWKGIGPLQVVVNAAGINMPEPAVETSWANWDRILAVNLTGAFAVTKAVAGRLIRAGQAGSFIHIASTFGLVGFPHRVAYSASKGGLIQMTRALAVEWASYGLRVNAIAPALVRTPLVARIMSDPAETSRFLNRIPMGRIAEPEDICGTAIYLAAPASAFVTGQVIAIDGGWTAQ